MMLSLDNPLHVTASAEFAWTPETSYQGNRQGQMNPSEQTMVDTKLLQITSKRQRACRINQSQSLERQQRQPIGKCSQDIKESFAVAAEMAKDVDVTKTKLVSTISHLRSNQSQFISVFICVRLPVCLTVLLYLHFCPCLFTSSNSSCFVVAV